ncbi:MAG: flavocytochrome c [Gordonibacter sp.]|uniref:flavocytochrome c n=1 Tax=Gordonibacter sp. TaxID=1968902 RepID=UPI002FC63322
METSLDRRGFLKTLAIGSVVAAGAGLAGCAPQQKGGASAVTTSGTGLPEAWDEECDVVVVGSGYAGLSAAYEASKAGADTMIVEKMSTIGGNSAIADGDFAVCMSSAQKAKGIEDSVDKYVADMMTAGLGLNDEAKCRVLAEKSNDTWEWTRSELGVEWDVDEKGEVNVIPYGGHNTVRTIHPALGHGSAMTVPLTSKLDEMGVPMKTNRMVVKFFRDETGRVMGIQVNEKAKGNDPATGDPRYIKANKGVVLASGGFGKDVAWRMQHDPHLDDTVDCTNQDGATAEALAAAMKAGALAVHLDWIQLGPWCSPDETGYGKGPSYIDANVAYGMSIDPQTGKRIVSELADRRVYSNAIVENGVPLLQIVDEQNIPKWNFEANLQPAIDAGITKKFATIDEVIAAYSLPDEFKAQFARYNGYVESGVDEEFGKMIPKDAKPLGAGPYYITRIWPKVHHTMGGVKTNMDAQVLDVDLKPIPGFYAAGEATGGVHGACRLGSCATADCLVNGRLAGQMAAKDSAAQ